MSSGRAWPVVKSGEPREAIKLHEITWGEPSPGQVLIRVRTAGAGFPDVMMAAGHFPLLGEPPFGLGKKRRGRSSPCRQDRGSQSAAK
jgi:NADPH2:quinone reductase